MLERNQFFLDQKIGASSRVFVYFWHGEKPVATTSKVFFSAPFLGLILPTPRSVTTHVYLNDSVVG